MIPIIYDNPILTGNGYGRMADAISCTVTHEINGQFELAMEYPVTGQHYDRIEAGMVLFAAPDQVTAEQPFRIYRVTRPLNGVVTVYARHIAYDMSGISVLPFTASSLSEAFSLLPSKCVPSCPFTFATTRSVASRIRTVTPMPLWSLLGGVAGSFLDVYGGEWDFNGLTASLPSSLGQDNGVSVRYGKNMTELEQDITVESTWAAVLPFWYNEETGQLVKTEQPVPVQGSFGSRVLTLDFSEEWEEAPTVAQLTARTEQYITANKIGDPQVAWKVNMAMLDQSEEYKGLAILERVQLGDTVTVIYEPYGIDVKARAVMIEYDVLAERYKNITLGRVKQNLAKIVASTPAEITAAVNAAKSALEKAIDSSTDFITHGGGYMRFIYNDDKVLQEIVSLDNPDINQAQSVWRWNNGGFGHSSTGYAGPYTVAMTQDGAIVADFITAGTLSGDRVRTGIITDVSGRNYWNLNTGEWKNVAIETTLENLQEQIDNNIETFTGPAVPTLTNYPANAWTTTEEKDKHIGDLYVVNSQGGDYEGFYYRFEKTGSTYQWRLLKDTEVTKALADAEEALRRVGIAETQIEQNAEAITLRATKTEAQGYANTAQANAISAAATDATTKANSAESAAKSYADAQITISADAITSNVSATYETKTDATGKLNTAKTYAEGQASAAERGAKNYTDGKLTDYSTTVQMNSAISQSAASITSTVSATYETKTDATSKLNTAKTYAEGQAAAAESNANDYTDGKLTDYSTTTQMESAIEQTAASITSTVSATYETKTDATTKLNTAKTYADGKASEAEDAANDYTDGKLTDYSTTVQMNSAIEQTASNITSTVSATYETKTDATSKLNTAKTYAEGQASSAETNAKTAAQGYANTAEGNAKGYTDGKLTDYSTTVQMNSAIEQTASNITSTVSATYETKSDATSKLNTAKTYADGKAATAESNAKTAAQGYADAAEEAANDYTDGKLVDYSTTTQMESAISQSASDITSTVSATYETKAAATQKLNTAKSYAETQAADAEAAAISTAAADATTKANAAEAGAKGYTDTKLTGYSTTTQMNSAISQSAGSILQTVSETYTTKTEFGGLEDDVEAVETRVSSAESTLEVQAGQIASKVSETDYNGNTIASKINQNATTVKINAAKIDLQGAVTISDFDSAAQAALVKNTTTKNQYAQSASSTTAPTSGWQDTIPAYNATNKYIWLRVATTKTFADNTSSTTYSTPVVDVNLTKSIQDAATAQSTATGAATAASTAQTTANNAASAASTAQTTANNAASAASTAQTTANNAATAASTAQSTADAALGTTKSTQQYYLSTSSTSATGGTWQDTVPTWSSGKYVWTRIKTDATTKSGTALSPVYSTAVYDANLTTALSTASSASSAASAAQSTADGAVTAAGTAQTTANNAASAASAAQTTANGAVKSSSVKTQYYLSTSASSATGGSWSDTIPTWADGKYLWTRIATTTTPVSGTASTTYQPSANGAYDSNLTNALSTATAAASTAAAAQTKANAALVTSVSVYFRASTSTVPGKPTAEVTSTAVDTSDAWTLCMPRPKKGTTYYTCEQNKDGNGTVSWTAVRQMANTTYVASWASSANATYIDGANIYTGTVTADKIAANEVFTQKLTAQDFNITGGSVNIETTENTWDKIMLKSPTVSAEISPVGLRVKNETFQAKPIIWNVSYTVGPSGPRSARTEMNSLLLNGNWGVRARYTSEGLYFIDPSNKSGGGVYATWVDTSNPTSIYGYLDLGNTSTNASAYLDSGGLVFKNSSNAVISRFSNTVESAEYTPSNDTITFLSSSRVYVFKTGTHGTISVQVNIQNGSAFAAGTDYIIATLPEQYRPKYMLRQFVPNQTGTSACMVSIGTGGAVKLYRYANSGAWVSSWIRAEIPVIFANP